MTKQKIDDKKTEDISIDIADIIINDMNDELRFKCITHKYIKIYKEKKSMTDEEVLNHYADFLYQTISEKFNDLTTKEDLKKLRGSSRTNAWKLKQRLSKSAIDSLEKKSNKLLHKEYKKACDEYEKYEKVVSLNFDTPDELIKDRKEFLKKWSSSNEYDICDYPYLNELTDKRIQAAFTHDLVFCVIELLRCNYDYDINTIVLESPAGVSPGLFMPHKRGRKSNALAVTKQGDNFSSKVYDVEDMDGNELDTFYEFSMEKAQKLNNVDEKLETLKLELINPETESKAIKRLYLDEQDLNIMRFVYTYTYRASVSFYISDLLKYLQLSDSKKNYERIEDKLIKLPCYTFYTEKYDEITNSKKRSSFNLFSKVDIETEPESKRRRVKVGKAYVEELEIVSTELMYKKELNKLTLPQSKNLAYLLEGRRSYEISRGINIKDKKYTYSIDYLKWYVHLDNKKSLKKNMLYLEEGLKEIMKNQFIIKKYEMNQSSFDVWFYEGFEKRKCLLNNTILSLEESNGNIIEV